MKINTNAQFKLNDKTYTIKGSVLLRKKYSYLLRDEQNNKTRISRDNLLRFYNEKKLIFI